MSCARPFKVCQRPGEKRDYAEDFLMDLIRPREANNGYALDVRVRPSTEELQTGFEYISSGGVTEFEEPVWPDTLGGTVIDGSVTWTAAVPTVDSLRDRLDTVVWTAHADVTVSDESIGDDAGQQLAVAWLTSLIEDVYEVSVLATTLGGLQLERIIELTIKE